MAWGRRRLGILLVTIVAAGGVLLSSAAADGAGTLVVTTTSDGSDGACTADLCSLRDAVEASNAAGGTVVSVPAGRYTLTLGPLFATAPLELDGAGARVTVIDGNDTEQVVRGDRAARPAIVLSDLTITGGNSQSGDAPDYNEGGGIISWGALTLTRVAVVGNTGQADGGGLNVQGDLTITDSTIANNTAGFSAGGIRAQGGAVSIANTTIAGNTAVERAAIDISLTSHASITNSTIAGNTNASGALDSVNSSSATVTLENDVIANDLTGGTPNCAGTFVSAGHNVATDGSCRLNAEGDLDRAGSVGLGALADNGGGTDTMLPRSGSPLVDAADAAACPAADQRGEARPQGGGCDIGAVETAGPARAGLVQLDAPGDCIAETEIEGCGTPTGAGLAGADWVTASPDGANVYVASSGRPAAVAAFARAADGSLSELGCIAVSGTECASTEAGLGFATSIAVSPDGKNVYVTAADDDTVMIFDRNAVDGTLTPAGCVQDAAARFDRGCATRVHGMVNAYDVAVSPDGKNVYVAAGGGFPELGAVVELARAADGSLSQLASPNDCIEEQGNATPVCGTSTGTGLLAATALALSPDGTSLYAVADTHAVGAGDAPGALAVFARDTDTGALTQSACIGEATSVTGTTECQNTTAVGLSDLVNVAVSPDGTSVYTASDDATGPIAQFARSGDGSLSSLGCIDSGGSICGATAPGLAAAFGVAVSPDGANVYVAAAGSSSAGGATPVAPGLVELTRAGDGTLAGSDCIQQAGAASQKCADTSGHGLGDALGVTVSPDGDNVYVASSSTGGTIAAFSRVAGSPPPPPSNQAPTAAFTDTVSGRAVSFDASASSDPDGTIASYSWDFGDGSASAGGAAPSHTFGAAGTYAVRLTVTDDDGAAASVTHDVVVSQTPSNAPPTARFAATTNGLQASLDGSVSSDDDGTVTSYAWDFGDGQTGIGATVGHAYSSAGTYTVTLTVTDDAGATDTATQTVTVVMENEPPQASFVVTPSMTPGSLAVVVDAAESTDTDGSVASYAWDFGDGAAATGRTAAHTYPDRGSYTITLTVTDDAGAPDTAVQSVAVPLIALISEPPQANFTATPSSTLDDLSVSVDASASLAVDGFITSYSWDFGDESAAVSGSTATHTYGIAGTYAITLTVTDSRGMTDTATQDVIVPLTAESPHASFVATPSTAPGDFELHVDATASTAPEGDSVASYAWDFGDGGTATGATSSHTYAAAGPYVVTLTIIDGRGVSDAVSKTVLIGTAVNPSFAFVIDGFRVSFTGSSPGVGLTYGWDFGDGTHAFGASTVHVYARAGSYPVRLVVRGSGGAAGETTETVNVVFAPPTVFAMSDFPGSLAVGDVSRDHDPDVVVAHTVDLAASTAQTTVSVLLGNGGGFLGSDEVHAAGTTPQVVRIADLNGDGNGDIVAAGQADSAISVVLGTSDGGFEAPRVYPVGFQPEYMKLADVNGDSVPDVVVGSAAFVGSPVEVGLGNGDGTFTFGVEYAYTGVTGIGTGDLNGDGKLDLVVAEQRSGSTPSATVRLGAGDGSFGAAASYSLDTCCISGAVGDVAVTDLDGDGNPDVVFLDQRAEGVRVLRGNGDGTLGAAQFTPFAHYPSNLAVGDLNSDGIPDLASTGDGVVMILFGKGDGTFGPSSEIATPQSPYWVEIGDFNRDHLADLAVAESGYQYGGPLTDNSVALYLNAVNGAPTTNHSPTATFTFSSNGLQLTADGSDSADSDGRIVTYAWSFGDGTHGSGARVTHTYASAGTYDVQLRVVDDDRAAGTETRTIAVPPHSVTVSTAGTGSGTLTSTPDGINCGRSCSSDLAGAGDVTLTATPAPGSVFAGWSGAGCSGQGACRITVRADVNVTAVFDEAGALAWSQAFAGRDQSDPAAPRSELHAVSCPDVSFCVAVGNVKIDSFVAGVVFSTSTSPTGPSPAWNALTATNNHATPTAVSCAAPALCVVVDSGGEVFVATDPVGGHWAGAQATSGALNGVSCPSASLCVAVGDDGIFVSTNPTGGPSTWSREVEAGLGIAFTAVSCSATSFCAAVDDLGDVVTSSNPAGGAAAWTPVSVGPHAFTGISCPSSSFCAAVDDGGDVVTSSRPVDGATAWTVSHIDPVGIDSISCPSAAFCAAGDASTSLLTSTDPAGGAGAWAAVAAPDPGQPLGVDAYAFEGVTLPYPILGISCVPDAAAPMCVAVDTVGDAFSGRQPILEASAAGPGSGRITSTPVGIDCGQTCTHGFFAGDQVVLRPAAGADSIFTGWSGACSGLGACAVTLTGDTAVTAAFGPFQAPVVSEPSAQPAAPKVTALAAAFTALPSSEPGSLAAAMDASSSLGQIASYSWDFGDGSFGSGVRATHTYARQGTYTVRLSIAGSGGGTATVSHAVTVPAGAAPAGTGQAGTLTVGSGASAPRVAWTARTFGAPVVVSVVPAPDVLVGRAKGSPVALALTVTTVDGAAVTRFSAPLEFTFPAAESGAVPAYSINGVSWTRMPRLAGTTLPSGFVDGWYRDRSGDVHVLTRHATYFGLLDRTVSVTHELRAAVRVAKRLDLRRSHTLRLRLTATLPSRVVIALRRGGHVIATIARTVRKGRARAFSLRVPRATGAGIARLAVTVTAGAERYRTARAVRLRG